MPGHWTQQFSFVMGALRTEEIGYLVVSNDAAAERKIPHAHLIQWSPAEWGNGGQVKWRVSGVAVAKHPRIQFCAIGEFGDAVLIGSGDRHEEKIGKGKRSPSGRGPLRGARAIGENVYVVGMDRQAYRRDGANAWSAVDKGLESTEEDGPVVGLEAIDGFNETDIYAVGWEGEVWGFDGGRWHRIDSPTSSVLVDVICGGDGNVYACGRNGLLVIGRNDQWRVHEQENFTEDLWSVAWFNDRLYAASMEKVFELQGDRLVTVDMGLDRAKTCYDLAVGSGRMWSIGAKDVMSFDGERWSRID
jgi:hypothetical protein